MRDNTHRNNHNRLIDALSLKSVKHLTQSEVAEIVEGCRRKDQRMH